MTLNGNWERESGEERTEEYRAWRTRLGFGGVCDVDQIEYDRETGRPLLIVEICVADPQDDEHPGGVRAGLAPSPKFFEAVESWKLSPERGQGRLLRYLANVFNVPLLRLVYIKGKFDRVWTWTDRAPVQEMTLDLLARILKRYHP